MHLFPKNKFRLRDWLQNMNRVLRKQLAKLSIRLDLASRFLINMVGVIMSLALFMVYGIDSVKDGEITNIRSSKCINYYNYY